MPQDWEQREPAGNSMAKYHLHAHPCQSMKTQLAGVPCIHSQDPLV